MAAPRLPFLYPNLMRAVRSCEPSTCRSVQFPARPSRHSFHTTLRREQQEPYQRRYGPAVEPNLPPPSQPKDLSSSEPAEAAATGKDEANTAEQKNIPPEKSQSQSQDTKRDTADASLSTSSNKPTTTESNIPQSSADPESHEEHAAENEGPEELVASAAQSSEAAREDGPPGSTPPNQSHFEHVYHLGSPSASLMPTGQSSSKEGAPHLTPGPYVHHFDTYSLVQDLSKGGFTKDQSVTIMKAVRSILQKNLDLAKENLTSKSDVENELYLFKAACSELQSSLQTARSSETQRQRTSRTQLQHEIDILSQRLNQDLAGMKDDIKGMFNDHSMNTREQQRSIDTSVQELNYKITVSLNSDGKSEIEGLRWVLTRRAAMTIGTCACKSLFVISLSKLA